MTRRGLLFLIASALIACRPAGGQRANTDQDPAQATLGAIGKRVTGDGPLTEYVRRIFQDSKGNYWFGCSIDVLFRYDGSKLELFSAEDGLAGTQVMGMEEDRNG